MRRAEPGGQTITRSRSSRPRTARACTSTLTPLESRKSTSQRSTTNAPPLSRIAASRAAVSFGAVWISISPRTSTPGAPDNGAGSTANAGGRSVIAGSPESPGSVIAVNCRRSFRSRPLRFAKGLPRPRILQALTQNRSEATPPASTPTSAARGRRRPRMDAGRPERRAARRSGAAGRSSVAGAAGVDARRVRTCSEAARRPARDRDPAQRRSPSASDRRCSCQEHVLMSGPRKRASSSPRRRSADMEY
jgi:hypothetical protein